MECTAVVCLRSRLRWRLTQVLLSRFTQALAEYCVQVQTQAATDVHKKLFSKVPARESGRPFTVPQVEVRAGELQRMQVQGDDL